MRYFVLCALIDVGFVLCSPCIGKLCLVCIVWVSHCCVLFCFVVCWLVLIRFVFCFVECSCCVGLFDLHCFELFCFSSVLVLL